MTFGWSGGPEGLRGWFEARRILEKAARRSSQEMAAVLGAVAAGGGAPDLAALVRLGGLSRARWFPWTGAGLATGERAGRGSLMGELPSTYSLRALVLATVASDLYLGYAALRERRRRWFPGLVGEEDWELQHRRGAGRVLDASEALGGVLIKADQFASTRPDLLPAASIAQAHRARLRDGRAPGRASGREVAVKVRYPGMEALVETNLDALETIFGAVARLEPDIRLKPIADYPRWTLPLELDLRREARAMEDLRWAFREREDVRRAVEGGGRLARRRPGRGRRGLRGLRR